MTQVLEEEFNSLVLRSVGDYRAEQRERQRNVCCDAMSLWTRTTQMGRRAGDESRSRGRGGNGENESFVFFSVCLPAGTCLIIILMSPEVFFLLLPLLILDAVSIMQYKFISHSLQPRGQDRQAESNAFFHREPSHFPDSIFCGPSFVSPYFFGVSLTWSCLTVTLTNIPFFSSFAANGWERHSLSPAPSLPDTRHCIS